MAFSKTVFSGIGSAQQTRRLPTLPVGNHEGVIKEVRAFESQVERKTTIVAELLIEKSSDENAVGRLFGWVRQPNKHIQYFLADVKNLVAAGMGCDEDEVDEASVAMVLEQNELEGKRVRIEVVANTKKPEYPGVFFSSLT